MTFILGLHSSFSGTSHDSSATLVLDGIVIGAIEEERINRKKTSVAHPPSNAVRELLRMNDLTIRDISLVVSDGITYVGMKEKVKAWLEYEFGFSPEIEIIEQPKAHVLGSFFSSGFTAALSISIEGVGDGISTHVSICAKDSDGMLNQYETLYSADKSKSLGNFYTAFTQYLGFESIEGEYKVMGMSALGKPRFDLSSILSFDLGSGDIVSNLSEVESEMKRTSLAEPAFKKSGILKYCNAEPRVPRNQILQEHFDLASSVQETFRSTYVAIIKYWVERTGLRYVCLSGGCALNALANMDLLELNIAGIYVMPAASDRGVSLGAAFWGSHLLGYSNEPQKSMFLGKSFSNAVIESELKNCGIPYSSPNNFIKSAAEDITAGRIIAWFQGRSEFGPRALGARSILANPRELGMKDQLNRKIKFREEYRPFAPAILDRSYSGKYTEKADLSKMTITVPVEPSEQSKFPEAVHTDGTSRVQVVTDDSHPFSLLLNELESSTGHGSVINTSFNLRGEPIVDSPSDALRTFYSSGIDVLYLEGFKIQK